MADLEGTGPGGKRLPAPDAMGRSLAGRLADREQPADSAGLPTATVSAELPKGADQQWDAADFARILPRGMQIDEQNRVTVHGHDVQQIAADFGGPRESRRPVLIYDLDAVEDSAREFQELLAELWGDNFRVAACTKPHGLTRLTEVAQEAGCDIEVASPGELYRATSANVIPENLVVHGNSKSEAYLCAAVELRAGLIVIDNITDVERLAKILQEPQFQGYTQKTLIRVNPSAEGSDTIEAWNTAHEGSKFGIDIPQTCKAAKLAFDTPGLRIVGLHGHAGSQLAGPEMQVQLIDGMSRAIAALTAELGDRQGFDADEMFSVCNIGGGFPAHYTPNDRFPTRRELLEVITTAAKRDLPPDTCLVIEPGKALTAEAGVAIYQGETIKNAGGKRVLGLNGSEATDGEHALYGQARSGLILGKTGQRVSTTVAGSACEGGDIFIPDALLVEAQPHDDFILFASGAYTYSFRSRTNDELSAVVVGIRKGKQPRLIAGGEVLADLTRREVSSAATALLDRADQLFEKEFDPSAVTLSTSEFFDKFGKPTPDLLDALTLDDAMSNGQDTFLKAIKQLQSNLGMSRLHLCRYHGYPVGYAVSAIDPAEGSAEISALGVLSQPPGSEHGLDQKLLDAALGVIAANDCHHQIYLRDHGNPAAVDVCRKSGLTMVPDIKPGRLHFDISSRAGLDIKFDLAKLTENVRRASKDAAILLVSESDHRPVLPVVGPLADEFFHPDIVAAMLSGLAPEKGESTASPELPEVHVMSATQAKALAAAGISARITCPAPDTASQVRELLTGSNPVDLLVSSSAELAAVLDASEDVDFKPTVSVRLRNLGRAPDRPAQERAENAWLTQLHDASTGADARLSFRAAQLDGIVPAPNRPGRSVWRNNDWCAAAISRLTALGLQPTLVHALDLEDARYYPPDDNGAAGQRMVPGKLWFPGAINTLNFDDEAFLYGDEAFEPHAKVFGVDEKSGRAVIPLGRLSPTSPNLPTGNYRALKAESSNDGILFVSVEPGTVAANDYIPVGHLKWDTSRLDASYGGLPLSNTFHHCGCTLTGTPGNHHPSTTESDAAAA